MGSVVSITWQSFKTSLCQIMITTDLIGKSKIQGYAAFMVQIKMFSIC
jgi:hypothetical protein